MKFCSWRYVDHVMKALSLFFGLTISFLAQGQTSVLSSGEWHKMGVTETGIYKLDRSTLSSLGFNVSTDPRTIKIYGNGVKGVLPQLNSTDRPQDLSENAIQVVGEADGSFDNSDYILFYGLGPDKEEWSMTGLLYENNIYSDTSYYFITSGGVNGKRIAHQESQVGTGTDITSFNDAIIFEEDVNNLLDLGQGGSGRNWYGEIFDDGETRSFNHNLGEVVSDVQLVVNAVGQSIATNDFRITANDGLIGNLQISAIPSGPGTTYSIKARQAIDTFLIARNPEIDFQVTYNSNSSSGIGFLDYYLLLFERSLIYSGGSLTFRNVSGTGALLRYAIVNGTGTTIWNVTDPISITNQQYDLNSSTAFFQSQSSQVEEFVAFSGSDFPAPSLFGSVSNQNIRGDLQLDGIIVSDQAFIPEAERLAQFHRDHDNLRVRVVTPRQVYNEFSSGRQDITAIRDYAKYVYDNGGSLRYLTLFGDCSFDYKDREPNNTNFVPTYESRDSFHPIFSHSSDDYFGFFEESEGDWIESVSGDHTLEIGVGRLPVKTLEEATSLVDKIIYYSTSPNTLGKWRNEIAYLADDGDGNIHAEHVESLSELIDTTYSQYNIDKLLLDAFEQEGASVQRSPDATSALEQKIKGGVFSINFIGHGNERLWTAEEVLTRQMIRDFTNRNNLPIFVTATCEFGRYDNPSQVSGAEELLLNENGGAIALLTTSRPVFASTNFELNEAFHENIFRRQDGSFQRLGDIMRSTKNDGLAGPVNRNFTLLGDPMMMPAYPKLDIVVNELQSEVDTLSALESVTFTGRVQLNGATKEDFNGSVSVSVFDIEQSFQTIGQESDPYNFTLRDNALFRGESTVEGGEFSFSLVVPKNISYQFKEGRMNFYASDQVNNQDAGGSSTNFLLGGTSAASVEDNAPPQVMLYLNDETFVNGSVVGSSSLLIAEVSDENGISMTSNGFSQGVSLELNDQIINLNAYFSFDLDSYQNGTIIYPIRDLDPGEYTAVLSVYDSYNNLTREEISFKVSDESFISIFDPKVFPNPINQEEATFSFEHDREDEDLEIELFVYSHSGEVVNNENFRYENANRSVQLPWQARTNSEQRLAPGIYFYRIIIRSRFDGSKNEIAGKLVVAN